MISCDKEIRLPADGSGNQGCVLWITTSERGQIRLHEHSPCHEQIVKCTAD